ncbi:hypothetical protein LPJ66_008174, partial [Kickxella alabastrina]
MSFQNANSGSDIVEIEKPQYQPNVDIDERDRDLLRRQQELEELDGETKLNWEMIKKLTVCGIAFLNDAYDMFAINIVAMILGFVYYNDAVGSEKNT